MQRNPGKRVVFMTGVVCVSMALVSFFSPKNVCGVSVEVGWLVKLKAKMYQSSFFRNYTKLAHYQQLSTNIASRIANDCINHCWRCQ